VLCHILTATAIKREHAGPWRIAGATSVWRSQWRARSIRGAQGLQQSSSAPRASSPQRKVDAPSRCAPRQHASAELLSILARLAPSGVSGVEQTDFAIQNLIDVVPETAPTAGRASSQTAVAVCLSGESDMI